MVPRNRARGHRARAGHERGGLEAFCAAEHVPLHVLLVGLLALSSQARPRGFLKRSKSVKV
jgi:hypothetical protein